MSAPIEPMPAPLQPPPAAGTTPHGLAMQLQVYDPARAAEPLLPVSPEEWEHRAREALADGPFGYVAGGAGAEDTMRANREAFARRRLVPRMLRDVSRRGCARDRAGTSAARRAAPRPCRPRPAPAAPS